MLYSPLVSESSRKKFSAPAASAGHSPVPHPPKTSPASRKFAPAPARALRVYAKRLNAWRICVYVLAKDARVCRQMMGATQASASSTPVWPVLAYLCDKARMAQHFTEHVSDGDALQTPLEVHNFAEAREREWQMCMGNRGERERSYTGEGRKRRTQQTQLLDTFFLNGSYAAVNAGRYPLVILF